jgi:hypothetical protein
LLSKNSAGFACCFCNLLAYNNEFGREFIEAFNRFCSLNDPGNYCCTINWRAATNVSALGWRDRFRSGCIYVTAQTTWGFIKLRMSASDDAKIAARE